MKRAVLCVSNPQDYIEDLTDYSIMIIEPAATDARKKYLIEKSDYSLLITADNEQYRVGGDYKNERVFWYTSGTTGDSKFYSFSQSQIDNMASTICRSYDITANDRYVSVMSLSHAHGQGFYWAAKMAGCDMKFLSLDQIRNLPKFSPTFITAIPGILRVIGNLDIDPPRFIRGASAALPNTLYQHLRDKFQVPVIEAFGMTEALSHCFTNPLHGEQRMGTVGLPDGVEAKIINDRLLIRGPTLFTPNWFDTGDLAEQDSSGYYRILGRHLDQININGYKINPLSIEQQLIRHFSELKSCIVFGKDRFKCLYVGDYSPLQIQNFLVSVNTHCFPYLLKQVDSLPLTSLGKISRTWLDKNYQ